ncbi:HerA-ATP synthase, barrel domain protein [Stanieria cyanosphaera PCC 7437]|uniref:HerA-ATP synthase, barrel domain protein n=1 Tax=Stanieria cyanosphaera (strain ATCC 29371 / PCC 7437) TaxID=111780 RepID=K9XYL2_STAC7|nr:HAS-barrel domain-containing protein [Stanieria cyanosphaera]AFZ37593.1 HerA-ATP synthase, barrel domain protein [Stanieria cyanosphaera PCC 7437]
MRLPLPQFAVDNRHPHHIAEVIETATTQFLAQCLEPDDLNFPKMPPFGSWVKSIDEESGNKIYAVVTYVTTTPIDSIHRARALGLSLAELREQQPQIFAMLKTEFKAAIVGFEMPSVSGNGNSHQLGHSYQYLPPRPPQIHQSVYHCEAVEVINFTEKLDFLRTLLQVKDVPVESLVAASIREVYRLRQANRDWLVQVGRNLSILLKDDYDRLRYILSQIHW